MKEIKVRGLIVQEAPMGDKDKRLILLTRELGKISVIAKGALSPKNRYSALCQLFCYGDYVLSKGRTFYYIQEAQLIESFYHLRSNLDRFSYAALMLEAAETLVLDGQENFALLRLLLRGLMAEQNAADGKESLYCDAFLWRALAENGFYPQLINCRICGKPLSNLPPAAKTLETEVSNVSCLWNAVEGGVVCTSCGKAGRGHGHEITAGTLRALRYIVEVSEEKVFAFDALPQIQKELHEVVISYLLQQTERRYSALDFIQNL